MSVPRVLVHAITAADRIVSIPEADAHHLLRVLRLKAGDDIRVFDGRGREWTGQLTGSGVSSLGVEIAAEIEPVPESAVPVTIAVGLLPRDQMDSVIRDAIMLGAAAIVPMVTSRVAVPERAWRSGGAITRWRRVAMASVKQCGRAVVPRIDAVTPFETLLHLATGSALIMCVEPGLEAVTVDAAHALMPPPTSALVLIGPEGGWTDEERAAATAAGATAIHLGPRTLRAETVPTVVLSALWTKWGW